MPTCTVCILFMPCLGKIWTVHALFLFLEDFARIFFKKKRTLLVFLARVSLTAANVISRTRAARKGIPGLDPLGWAEGLEVTAVSPHVELSNN